MGESATKEHAANPSPDSESETPSGTPSQPLSASEPSPEVPEDPVVAALEEAAAPSDTILESVKALLRHHGFPRSDTMLRSGVDPKQTGLKPKDALRELQKLGFKAQVTKRKASGLSDADAPSIVFLKDGGAALLVATGEGDVTIAGYEGMPGQRVFSLQDFEAVYAGYTLIAKPDVGLRLDRYTRTPIRPRSWFWAPIFSNWWYFTQVILATVLVNMFAIVTPFFVMIVYDRVIPNQSIDTLWVLAAGMALLLLFDFLLKTLRARFVDTAAKRADIEIGRSLFEQVLTVNLGNRPKSAGSFGSTLKEFEALREFFSSATLIALIDLPFTFLFLFVLWAISGDVALVLFAAVPFVILYGVIVQIPLHYSTKQYLQESHAKHGVLIETINTLETVRGVGAERRMRQIWADSVDAAAISSIRTKAWSASSVNVTAVVQQATSVGVVLFGVHMILAQQLTMGGLIACVMLGGRALAPMAQVAQILTKFHQSRNALKALNDFMKQPTERPRDKDFVTKNILDGSIEFRDVCFQYEEEGAQVLKNVSFKINPGESVGIIGRIGSGKSTLAQLMLGMYTPTEGQILVGGVDVRQMDPGDLRRNIGYVPQDIVLFSGTIRDNITASAIDADDAAIQRVATAAGLGDFLNESSAGLDHVVGERGDGLSGGQRQAVTVARALIRDPSILLLDEPTSAMDARSEADVTSSVRATSSVDTIVLITHRTSLLTAVDRLIVLDHGTVKADGPRDDVMRLLSERKILGGKA